MTEWPLPLRASRLMECKVPFNISTGVRDNDPGALGGLRFNGRPRKSIPGKVLLERTGDVTHRAMGDYKSVIFFRSRRKTKGALRGLIYRMSADLFKRLKNLNSAVYHLQICGLCFTHSSICLQKRKKLKNHVCVTSDCSHTMCPTDNLPSSLLSSKHYLFSCPQESCNLSFQTG